MYVSDEVAAVVGRYAPVQERWHLEEPGPAPLSPAEVDPGGRFFDGIDEIVANIGDGEMHGLKKALEQAGFGNFDGATRGPGRYLRCYFEPQHRLVYIDTEHAPWMQGWQRIN